MKLSIKAGAEALDAWLRDRPEAVTFPPGELHVRQDKAAEPGRVRRFESGQRGDLTWRLDRSTIVRHANGWIDITGVATRSGVLPYLNADGSERLELRPEREVFDPRSMASMVGVPFTNNHPDVALDVQNTQQHQVGTVLAVARRDNLLEARIRLTSAQVIQAVADGKVELSGGYSTEVVDEAGVTDDGERYDAIQTNIRYNHLALVDEARAGPVARLRLDRGDAVKKQANMLTIKIRDNQYQVRADALEKIMAKAPTSFRADQIETESVSIAGADLVLPKSMVEAMLAALTGAPPPAEPEPEPMEAGADEGGSTGIGGPALDGEGEDPTRHNGADKRGDSAMAARLDKLERTIAGLPNQVRAQLANRGRIERIAAQVLPSNYRYDQADDLRIMADAIVAVSPDAKVRTDEAVKAKRAEYLQGVFETVVETRVQERSDELDPLAMTRIDARTGTAPAPTAGPPSKVTRIDAARGRYYDRIHGRKPEDKASEEGAA